MKVNVGELLTTLKEEGVTSQSREVKPKELKTAGLKETAKSLLDNIVEQAKAGKISQAEVTNAKQELSIRLEMNVINLPVRYVNPMEKILDSESEAEVNVYMIVEAPKVTRSGLRIDLLGTVDDVIADPTGKLDTLVEWLTSELEAIEENKQEKPKED